MALTRRQQWASVQRQDEQHINSFVGKLLVSLEQADRDRAIARAAVEYVEAHKVYVASAGAAEQWIARQEKQLALFAAAEGK